MIHPQIHVFHHRSRVWQMMESHIFQGKARMSIWYSFNADTLGFPRRGPIELLQNQFDIHDGARQYGPGAQQIDHCGHQSPNDKRIEDDLR